MSSVNCRLCPSRDRAGVEPITTKISQETLAEMVGTTRPRAVLFSYKV